ncbi:hypothetical protein LCGC14_1240900 [marine sediment metagenome]|uniref:Uncharacterized protein n=1 Tax=marine sediment metagenome TaxID=412755 RepID=A0A0F9NN06_9ZZZZ
MAVKPSPPQPPLATCPTCTHAIHRGRPCGAPRCECEKADAPEDHEHEHTRHVDMRFIKLEAEPADKEPKLERDPVVLCPCKPKDGWLKGHDPPGRVRVVLRRHLSNANVIGYDGICPACRESYWVTVTNIGP